MSFGLAYGFLSLFFLVNVFLENITRNRFTKMTGVNYSAFSVFIIVALYFYGLHLIGFRPFDAGYDTPGYVKTYSNLQGILTAREVGFSNYGNTELLFWPIQGIFKYLSFPPREWLIALYTINFIQLCIVYRKISSYKEKELPLYLFATVLFSYDLVYMGNAIRQFLSIPFGFLFIYFWGRGKFVISAVWLLVGIGLHWATLFFAIAPLFSNRFFNNRKAIVIYFSFVLLGSMLLGDIAKIFISILDYPPLTIKYNLYFSEEHISHMGAVYRQANFWLCLIFLVIYLVKIKYLSSNYIVRCSFLCFLSLIIIGVRFPDFSERFFPILFVLQPYFIYLASFSFFSQKQTEKELLASTAFGLCSVIIGGMVVFRESSRITLGY